jgi:hypothetical protein
MPVKLGGHKAAAIAMALQFCSIYLVSELKDSQVLDSFFESLHDLQCALN